MSLQDNMMNEKEKKFEFKIKNRKQFYLVIIFFIFILLGSIYFYEDTNLSLLTQLMNVYLLLILLVLISNYIINAGNYPQKYPNRIRYLRIIGTGLFVSTMIVFYIYFFSNINY